MAFPTSKTSGFRHIRSMAAPPHVVGLLNHHPPPTRLALPRQQTQAIKVACEACRKRKGKGISKCTGERPSCRFCNERGYKCEYDSEPMQTRSQALRRQNEILVRERSLYEDLYRLLMILPSVDVTEMLHQLRSGAKFESVVTQARDGAMLLDSWGPRGSTSAPAPLEHRSERGYSDRGPITSEL
ncbi:hypothetical protein BN1708_011618 [Verticillium longisporum]|uniref:Zn(2)-C6 fungal-type domain-containing protein n=1 Tax=Verticillium longisporum TaxID=100787 RepID=A0A0G4L1W5_VERLO|nr:hypothetical protein BN1708_011618 [Verticillium longisporum]